MNFFLKIRSCHDFLRRYLIFSGILGNVEIFFGKFPNTGASCIDFEKKVFIFKILIIIFNLISLSISHLVFIL
jgi:hypothetical protein